MPETAESKRSLEAWGTATLDNGLYLPNGRWIVAISGYLKVITDKDWNNKNFRSAERWQLLIFADEDCTKIPVFVIPGCNVKGAYCWIDKDQKTKSSEAESRVFDATSELVD